MDSITLIKQHQNNMKVNEQEMSDVLAKKRALEDGHHKLLDWKRRDMVYLNQLHNELQGEAAKEDRRQIEGMIDSLQKVCRSAEQQFEREFSALNQKQKKISAQKETLQAEYQRAVSKEAKRGTST